MQELKDPRLWAKGINLATLKELKFAEINNQWIRRVLQDINNAEIDTLFEQPMGGKRKIETVAMESKEVNKDISDALNKPHMDASVSLKKAKAEAKTIVQEWFDSFHLNGKSGHIGLVPESLQDEYPTNAPNCLDPVVREHMIHFYEWLQKQK